MRSVGSAILPLTPGLGRNAGARGTGLAGVRPELMLPFGLLRLVLICKAVPIFSLQEGNSPLLGAPTDASLYCHARDACATDRSPTPLSLSSLDLWPDSKDCKVENSLQRN